MSIAPSINADADRLGNIFRLQTDIREATEVVESMPVLFGFAAPATGASVVETSASEYVASRSDEVRRYQSLILS